MNYSKVLYNQRDRLGLTNVEMAQVLKISDSLYSRYEKNKQTIPIKHLNTLSNYFNCSLDYMFGFTDEKNYPRNKKEINRDLMRERLRELRKENNLTQKELAASINVASSTISDCERKANVIATSFLYDLCKKYGFSADYLLGKTNKPKYYVKNL